MPREKQKIEYAAKDLHGKSDLVECADVPEKIECAMSTDAMKRVLFDADGKLLPEMRGTKLHKVYLRRMKVIRNMRDKFSERKKK